jgi:hypothetical protein
VPKLAEFYSKVPREALEIVYVPFDKHENDMFEVQNMVDFLSSLSTWRAATEIGTLRALVKEMHSYSRHGIVIVRSE